MKALLSRTAGVPETLTLEEVPDPVPGPGQLLIRVAACGVNFPDVLIIEDRYQIRPPRPFAPGAEVAGTVAAIGADVDGFAAGDRVMAITSWGGMAELVAVDADKCVAIPDTMPLDEAAALLMTYGTACHALECGSAAAGETMLVLGAAGGVGLAAVEIGKARGLNVIAAVSSEQKAQVAREAGANAAIVYSRGPLDRDAVRALAKQLRNTADIRLAIDPVGGDYSEAALRALGWGGRLVVIGFAAGIPSVPLNLVLMGDTKIVGAPWGAVVATDPAGFARTAARLLDLYAKGAIRPRISARFPLAEGGQAIAALGARAAIGKVIVEVGAR